MEEIILTNSLFQMKKKLLQWILLQTEIELVFISPEQLNETQIKSKCKLKCEFGLHLHMNLVG